MFPIRGKTGTLKDCSKMAVLSDARHDYRLMGSHTEAVMLFLKYMTCLFVLRLSFLSFVQLQQVDL